MTEIPLSKTEPFNSDPRQISLFFDGEEVARIEDGNLTVHQLQVPGYRPKCLQIEFDRQLVYECFRQEQRVSVNRLASAVALDSIALNPAGQNTILGGAHGFSDNDTTF